MKNTDECPVCHALIFYEIGKEIHCDYCGNRLLVGNSDPTGHCLTEIDPEVWGGSFGVFCINLHPVGTKVCVQCKHIYPEKFECCPNLVDVAFAAYNEPKENWGPKTQERITDFLCTNKTVVANTAQLRILQSRYRYIDSQIGEKITRLLKELGLNEVLEKVAKE